MQSGAKRSLLFTCLALSAPALLAAASPAFAQEARAEADGRDEIVVTATLRRQALQDVPIAINVIGEAAIKDLGAADLAAVVETLPGVELRASQAGSGAVSIRGISELNTDNIFGATGTAVGLYIDNTPFSIGGFFPQSAVVDVSRVEVLRGPQGTIFGEGSLAGTIRLISNAPDSQAFDASVNASYGQIEDGGVNTNVSGVLNVPLVKDRLAFRASAFQLEEGGWIDRVNPVVTATFLAPPNPFLGATVPDVQSNFAAGAVTEDVNDASTQGGRAALLWTPTEGFSATLSSITQTSDRGTRSRGRESRVGSFSTDLEGMDDEFTVNSLVLEQVFSFGSVLSATNQFDRTIEQTQDQIGIVPLGNQLAYPLSGGTFVFQGSRVDQDLSVEEFNQELRFVSEFDGPFQITAGLFYRERDVNFRIRAPLEPLTPGAIADALAGGALGPVFAPGPVPDGFGDLDSRSTSNNTQSAAFAEGTLALSQSVTLLAGARVFRDERSSTTVATSLFGGLPFPTTFRSSAEEDVVNPRASITFEPNDDLTVYLSAGRGFRSGGQNDLFSLVAGSTAADLVYDSEHLTTYEFGLKGRLGGGALRYSAALFQNDWEDLQVVTAEGGGGVGEIIGNAGSARSIGIDLEAALSLGERFTVTAAATVLDAELENVTASRTLIRSADIPGVAETTASLAATFRQPISGDLGLFLRAGANYKSDSLGGLLRIGTPNERVPGYTTVDVRGGVETRRWALTLFVDNATDEVVPTSQFLSVNPSVPSGGDPITGEKLFFQASPRVIGVNLSWRLNP